MHTKQQLREKLAEEYNAQLETIEKIPDDLEIGVSSVSRNVIYMNTIMEGTAEEQLAMIQRDLRKFRRFLSDNQNWELTEYHMLWSSTMGITYKFGNLQVLFYVYKVYEEVLKIISDGKCHVEFQERPAEKRVVCNI